MNIYLQRYENFARLHHVWPYLLHFQALSRIRYKKEPTQRQILFIKLYFCKKTTEPCIFQVPPWRFCHKIPNFAVPFILLFMYF